MLKKVWLSGRSYLRINRTIVIFRDPPNNLLISIPIHSRNAGEQPSQSVKQPWNRKYEGRIASGQHSGIPVSRRVLFLWPAP